MFLQRFKLIAVCLVGVSLIASSASGHYFEVSDYQPQGGEPPAGGSIIG